MRSLRSPILACLLLLNSVAFAQNITGSTQLDIDQVSGSATATCETDLDYDTQAYYAAEVNCSVMDSNGNRVAYGSYYDMSGQQGYAQVVLTFTTIPGTTYTATGSHYGEMLLGDYTEPQPQQPPYFAFYDYYNFSSFEGGVPQTYEGSYDWYGPGPEQKIRPSKIHTGNTNSNNARIPKITLAFTNPRNPQDMLKLVDDGKNCSENLGPKACPSTGWYLYALEGSVIVNDDASKWTVKQTAGTLNYSGYSKDSNGALHSFSNSLPGGPDGPDAPHFLQQNSGTKTIFWIDSPARRNIRDDGNNLDSITWVQNYSVKVCSLAVPSVCGGASWYVRLVVSPGGVLSPTSTAALGSL